ncbi:MAG: thioredoxin family protein [Chitinophagaceae bacterium]|nr:thioredoxin family protein [Chitinophagaceae bacterium]
MKTFLSYAVILFFGVLTFSSCKKKLVTKVNTPVGFFENDWAGAMAKANELDRKVFVQFYADWCTHCESFKKNTLNDPTTETYLKENFVVVLMDMEKGVGKEKYELHKFEGIPVLAVFDKTEALKGSKNGNLAPTDFKTWIDPLK